MSQRDIVSAIDGSEASHAALRWAAAEARRSEAPLHVVYVYENPWPPVRPQDAEELAEIAHQQAQVVVDQAVADLKQDGPGLDIRGGAVPGLPAQVLIELSRTAGVVVVGNRGRGGFASLMLGSVSDHVSTHAHSPVVVVRGRTDAGVGPVTVGYDGSPGSEYALGIAFEEASRRASQLAVVTAYSRPLSAPGIGVPPLIYDRDKLEADLRSGADRAVAGWQDKYPGVVVDVNVVNGQAAHVLATASQQSRLVVVGARGHGGLDWLPLGSVGRQLLHHAHCPVMIARS